MGSECSLAAEVIFHCVVLWRLQGGFHTPPCFLSSRGRLRNWGKPTEEPGFRRFKPFLQTFPMEGPGMLDSSTCPGPRHFAAVTNTKRRRPSVFHSQGPPRAKEAIYDLRCDIPTDTCVRHFTGGGRPEMTEQPGALPANPTLVIHTLYVFLHV